MTEINPFFLFNTATDIKGKYNPRSINLPLNCKKTAKIMTSGKVDDGKVTDED